MIHCLTGCQGEGGRMHAGSGEKYTDHLKIEINGCAFFLSVLSFIISIIIIFFVLGFISFSSTD
jgi:hypothetical protein